ncbi:MAG: hypothetical protein HC774_06105 [Sphingomonadales bacterium]|nr:hypothetical protein [Sphingomonadales bacterium]
MQAAIAAIRGDKNGYSVTQGIPELQQRLQRQVDEVRAKDGGWREFADELEPLRLALEAQGEAIS